MLSLTVQRGYLTSTIPPQTINRTFIVRLLFGVVSAAVTWRAAIASAHVRHPGVQVDDHIRAELTAAIEVCGLLAKVEQGAINEA